MKTRRKTLSWQPDLEADTGESHPAIREPISTDDDISIAWTKLSTVS